MGLGSARAQQSRQQVLKRIPSKHTPIDSMNLQRLPFIPIGEEGVATDVLHLLPLLLHWWLEEPVR